MVGEGHPVPELLATPETVKGLLHSPSLCLIDTRPAEKFAQGHIPGAVHFDLFGLSLNDTSPGPLKAFLSMMHHLFELRGVDRKKKVVFYEDTSGMRAARGLWFLNYFGHPDTQVLDGGMTAWKRTGNPISSDATSPSPSELERDERSELLATADQVLDSLRHTSGCIVDTRSKDEYMGRLIRAARGGAVPGAHHLEWTNNLDPRGMYKPLSELKAMYQGAGIDPDKEILVYCQGGYRSAHSYLALKLLGYPRVRNYLGSWKEWGDRLDLPIEKPWEDK